MLLTDELKQSLINIAGDNVKFDEPMKKHITFRVGGPATGLVNISKASEITEIIELCKLNKIPYYIIGNGSNLLVKDQGYEGVIIEISNNFNDISVSKSTGDKCTEDTYEIYAQAGALLSKIAAEALKESLEGFEFASGIPGTLGGAVVMNAGAYGSEMKDVIKSVDVLDDTGKVLTISGEEMGFGYRTSIVEKEKYIVLGATIILNKGNQAEIKEKMADLNSRRRDKQPLEYPSAGSTFKRPTGYFAGKLIEDAGLKGYTVGGAKVSEKHSGFVINFDDATAADVLKVIEDVKAEVFRQTGVTLEKEVKVL